jgi:pyruvate ferredoxin oxidoreductase alpha subunit
MKVKVLSGDHAVAYAVNMCRVDVIPNYPITPQTLIIEKLSDFVFDGECDATFMAADSEHSAMSMAIGAAATGVRTFTATASQGLALMHEMLYVAPQTRLPIVMANVNRSLGAGSGIWAEYNDSMPERESGWMQCYVEDAQEAFDTIIQAYRLCEDQRVMLPLMMCLDAFVLSHTVEKVVLPDQAEVVAFLPRFRPLNYLDAQNPKFINVAVTPAHSMEMRYQLDHLMRSVGPVVDEVDALFSEHFGRGYGGSIQSYRMEDAEHALITLGTATSTARVAVDELRKEGKRVGLVKLKYIRPFPHDQLRAALRGVSSLGVFDRSIAVNGFGPVFTEVRNSCYGMGIPITNHIAGIGGRDLTVATFRAMFDIVTRDGRARPDRECFWHGLRGEM